MSASTPIQPPVPATGPVATPIAEPPLVTLAVPIDHHDAGALAATRALFARARFDEATVARRLGGSQLFGFQRKREGRTTMAGPVEDDNAALIRLLVDTEPLDASLAERLCGREGIDALRALGVLVPDAEEPSRVRATVLLAPVQGVWLASDLPPGGRRLDPRREPADFVFPALSDLTREFLQVIDDAPGLRALELCAGTGVAALRAARRGAREAWATDIGERSVRFARFNAALSGLDGVEARVSDVWDALDGERFDRVYAHPPYVPALSHTFDYRDAGEDGEQVTRRIVEGLPAHLAPGGRCSLTCAITDRRNETVEARLRRWLGDAASEFDVVVLVRRDWDVMRAYRSIVDASEGFRDAERWLSRFDLLGIERFMLVSMELRRSAAGRAPVTVRRRAGPHADAAAIDWLARWERFLPAEREAEQRLAGLRPRVVPGCTARLSLRADAALDWRTVGAEIEVEHPAPATVTAPPVVATLLELCDGTRDVPALLASLRAAELIGDDVGEHELARLVELLLAAGALEVEGCPVPRPAHSAIAVTSSVPTQSTRQ